MGFLRLKAVTRLAELTEQSEWTVHQGPTRQ